MMLEHQSPARLGITNPNSPSLQNSKESASLFTVLQEILDLQDSKSMISREFVRSKDSPLLTFTNKLKEAERVLDMLVEDYTDYRSPKRLKFEEDGCGKDDSQSHNATTRVKVSDILSLAHRISCTTFAPPEFGAGKALPPAPQEDQMRASQLFNLAGLDVGLPRVLESRETEITMLPAPASLVIPSGWKIGDPVELPDDLSMLPPLDSIPAAHEAPAMIQVQHVQLDILDQDDDDSSDYSSDEESSSSDDDDD